MSSIAQNLVIENLKSAPKEKLDMILEPMQVMIQLALLGSSPRGTKISIQENILTLQRPTYFQGVWRWYSRDCREDLYYLFHAIRRYYLWYKNDDNDFYTLILNKAKKGLSKLIETYQNTDQTSLLHTLTLYKNILDLENPDLFKTEEEGAVSLDIVFQKIKSIYNKKILLIVISVLKLIDLESVDKHKLEYYNGLQEILKPLHQKIKTWIREKLTC